MLAVKTALYILKEHCSSLRMSGEEGWRDAGEPQVLSKVWV